MSKKLTKKQRHLLLAKRKEERDKKDVFKLLDKHLPYWVPRIRFNIYLDKHSFTLAVLLGSLFIFGVVSLFL